LLLVGLTPFLQRLNIAWRRPALLLTGVAGLAFWVFVNVDLTRQLRTPQPWRNVHKELASFIRQHAKPSDLTASLEVGTLAYWSDRPILDLLSLTSPETLPWARRRDFEGAIRHFRPRFVAAYIFDRLDGYREVARWDFMTARDYIVWERASPDDS
jgi:hypothetical protein